MHFDLKRDGFDVVERLFTEQEVNDIRAYAFMCLQGSSEDAPYKSGRRLQKRGKYPALLFWPALQSPCMDEIRLSLAPVIRRYLGDDVRQLNNQLYFRLPGDGDAFAWHQDVMFRKDFEGGPYDYLQTALCIDPMSEDNGGIGFVCESHTCEDLHLVDKANLRKPTGAPIIHSDEGRLPVVFPSLNPGDLLVWSHMTVHGSGKNDSNHTRMTYMSGFGKSECCTGWPDYLKDGSLVEAVDTDAIPYS